MPQVQGFPTWKNINAQNSTSSSGQTDNMTGEPYYGEGLYPGVYADLTNYEAGNASNPNQGTGVLYSGRYRWVQVDSGANAANVTTGTVGYMRSGSVVKSAVTTNVGSGLTNGVYEVSATAGSGGGQGAILQISVAGNVIVGNPVVLAGGFGYVNPPTFSLTALGGSAAAVQAQLNTTPNIVTSADQIGATIPTAIPVRPVVFLNPITPGNYGFIQELGTATVLANGTVGTAAIGAFVNAVTSNSGTVTTTAQSGSPIGSTIGVAIDLPANSILFKAQLGYACMDVQD